MSNKRHSEERGSLQGQVWNPQAGSKATGGQNYISHRREMLIYKLLRWVTPHNHYCRQSIGKYRTNNKSIHIKKEKTYSSGFTSAERAKQPQSYMHFHCCWTVLTNTLTTKTFCTDEETSAQLSSLERVTLPSNERLIFETSLQINKYLLIDRVCKGRLTDLWDWSVSVVAPLSGNCWYCTYTVHVVCTPPHRGACYAKQNSVSLCQGISPPAEEHLGQNLESAKLQLKRII